MSAKKDNPGGTEGNGHGDAESVVGLIEPIEIQEEMERSFLDYSMSVIVARALPDAKDGLKPVHRRILYGMLDLGARPDRAHMKSARITGHVMGRYHPHGSQAIYDALVRMAQDFSLRHPLVDGHGNFGSPDDPPAAERYCVTGDTMVRLADGTSRRIDGLVADAEPNSDHPIEMKVLDRLGNPVLADMFFHSGNHPTKRIRTRAGFELTGSHNHPVLCLEPVAGVPMLLWRRLDEVDPGTVVCISRTYRPETDYTTTEEERYLGVLAGMLVSEGWATEKRAGFNNTDEELAELVGARSAEKRVPRLIWEGTLGLKRIFLRALFEGDGCVCLGDRNSIHLCYDTQSEGLARDVQLLLLEFGVASRLVHFGSRRAWRVSITNRRDARLFAERVNFLTRKRAKLAEALAAVPQSSRAMSADHIPFMASYVREEAGRGHREWLSKRNFDRWERLEALGEGFFEKIRNPEAEAVVRPLVEAGYFYDTVASVEDAGVRPVYSVRVASEDHSFLAGGFVNHNTEARLGQLAMEMLAGIDENTVDFVDNYTGEFQEPSVLPSRFPNLLVNGSQGIAVGMATNIPTHNLGEVVDACIHVLDHPDATPDDLMKFVKGPDFPTAGLILGRAGIQEAFRTGRGSIKLRARAEFDETKRGPVIVVTEVPYQTSPSQILGKIADLVHAKQLEGVRNVNDASARGNTRLIIELKRDANPNVVLNNLYKHTPLQTYFGVNTVALVDGVPRTLNLAQAVSAYVEHQVVVVRRRTEFRLEKARARAHIVEGLIKALDMIDEIIAAIRGSADREEARTKLMAKPFEFTEVQANHILDMTLARLTRLGRQQLEEEMAELRRAIAELEAILADEEKLKGVISTELSEIREKWAEPRRTEITFDPGEMDVTDLIEDEEVVVVKTQAGYIKTVQASAFRTQGRGGRGVAGAKLKEEDLVTDIIHTSQHAHVLFFSNRGRVFRLRAHEIPMKERTARGTAMPNLLPLGPEERVEALIATRDFPDDHYLFFATRQGQVKKTVFSEYDKSRREGFIAINLRKGDELVRVIETGGDDDIFMVSRLGMTIRFAEDDVRPMGRDTSGVRGMRLKKGDHVVSCDVARDDAAILIITSAGYGKRTQLDRFNPQGRGGQGVRGIKLTEKKGYVVASFMVGLDDDVVLISSGGVAVRIPVREVSSQGRDATGVRVMNLDKGQVVASAAPILVGQEEV